MKKLVFFGADKFVLPILEALHKQYEIPLILTTEKLPTDPISTFAKTKNTPRIPVTTFTPEIISKIKDANVEIAILAYFGLILPQSILSLFPKGIINVHPSLLPKFRGPTPVQSAILSGEKETGISIIKLDDAVDHGPILAQETEPISDEDTAETLHEKLFAKGAKLLIDVLPKYISGELIPKPQDDTKATFTEKLNRNSGYIDPKKFQISSRFNRDQIDKMIRAYFPWPGVWTTIRIKNKELRIKFLPGNKLQVEGKKPMSYRDFLNGYPDVQREILSIINNL